MRVLGFDTATDLTAVAATDGGEVLFETAIGPEPGGRPAHATRLLPAVEEAVAAAGGWEEIERLAVGTGPGSFTGLRIGIATARALARAEELELAGAGTLEALARGALHRSNDRPVLAALDARRGELFTALFGAGGEQLAEPAVDPPDEVAKRVSQLAEAPLAVGSGALRFCRELRERGAEIPGDDDPSHRVSALEICAIGAEANARLAAEPLYLRRPDAERWRERDGKDN
jgi:tRNA threonylcarbamoyladenosine biosynthesis protein TsaB